VLSPRLPHGARVMEIASGAGEHAVFVAAARPDVTWQPSDPDPEALTSIATWRDQSGLTNVAAPVRLDASDPTTWPTGPFDAIVCINMIHISPWAATLGLMAGASRVLSPAGRLFLYGPYFEADVATVPSNRAFDQNLKGRNPAWGLRDLGKVKAAAASEGRGFAERIAMPANNLSVIFGPRLEHP
jgi:hypothetical protein